MAYTISIFGDSITFGACDGTNGGWCGRLKRYFEAKGNNHRIYNLGISGNTSREILERFDVEAKARLKFKREGDRNIIIFATGINDSFIRLEDNVSSVGINDFKINIQTLLDKAKTYTKEVVFISIIPVDDKLSLDWEGLNFTNERAQQYNTVIKDICEQNQILFFDIFEEFSKLNYKELLNDGLHPNSKGYEEMYELIKDFLVKNNIIN